MFCRCDHLDSESRIESIVGSIYIPVPVRYGTGTVLNAFAEMDKKRCLLLVEFIDCVEDPLLIK